jgi:hypothetical protein
LDLRTCGDSFGGNGTSVLRSSKAAEISIYIVRAFVRLREMVLSNNELSRKLADMEKKPGVSLSNPMTLNFALFLERSGNSWLRKKNPNVASDLM